MDQARTDRIKERQDEHTRRQNERILRAAREWVDEFQRGHIAKHGEPWPPAHIWNPVWEILFGGDAKGRRGKNEVRGDATGIAAPAPADNTKPERFSRPPQ